jgi:ribosomal-protein-alanine N-acetyltransferase
VELRALSLQDGRAWREVRARNAEWLRPWEATVPVGDTSAPRSFRSLVRDLHRQARAGRALPFALTVEECAGGLLRRGKTRPG